MRGVDFHGARLWQPLLFGIAIVPSILSLNDTNGIIEATFFFKSLNNNNNKTNEINTIILKGVITCTFAHYIVRALNEFGCTKDTHFLLDSFQQECVLSHVNNFKY